jgi:hypothetical protein
MTASKRKLLSLNDTTKDLLRRAAGQANGESAYVESIVARAWSRWTEALDSLLQSEWKRHEVLAVCRKLGGHHIVARLHTHPEIVAESMPAHAPDGITQARWLSLRRRMKESYRMTSALTELAAEYAAGNAELIAMLSHPDPAND